MIEAFNACAWDMFVAATISVASASIGANANFPVVVVIGVIPRCPVSPATAGMALSELPVEETWYRRLEVQTNILSLTVVR